MSPSSKITCLSSYEEHFRKLNGYLNKAILLPQLLTLPMGKLLLLLTTVILHVPIHLVLEYKVVKVSGKLMATASTSRVKQKNHTVGMMLALGSSTMIILFGNDLANTLRGQVTAEWNFL